MPSVKKQHNLLIKDNISNCWAQEARANIALTQKEGMKKARDGKQQSFTAFWNWRAIKEKFNRHLDCDFLMVYGL